MAAVPFVVFSLCLGLGDISGHPARVGEDVSVAQPQEVVQLGEPVPHAHRLAGQSL
ncbi:hypothetical protein D3C81_1784610 [compost metagenome]